MGNEDSAIKRYIERITDLLGDIEASKSDEQQTFEELKQKGHPTAALRTVVAQMQKDEDKAKKTREEIKLAGSLLGVPVFAEKVDPDTALADQLVRQRVDAILHMREDRKELTDQLKAVKKEAEGEGFAVPILMKVIEILREGVDEYEAYSLTLDTYLKAARE